MKIIETKELSKCEAGKKVIFTSYERTYENKSGKKLSYFFVSRGSKVENPSDKKPDAVVVVATKTVGTDKFLVVTKEFRVAIGRFEIGFPAGLIDEQDYHKRDSVSSAAKRAAVREMREETGLDFNPKFTSPNNLYSSAGLTDESVVYVFGEAYGNISDKNQEESENIETFLLSVDEASELVYNDKIAHSKSAWPFLFMFANGQL